MSYHLYHTPALVLGSTPVGEGSRTILLFTRELGLVSARAQGIRLARSKLRYHLTDFSYTDAWLVRGREIWRLANAVSRANFFSALDGQDAARLCLGRAALLLRRLLPPEEKHEKLFDAVVSCAAILQSRACAPGELRDIEILLALRILFHLGYLGEPREFLDVAAGEGFGAFEISSVAPLRRQLVSIINSSLRVTGL
ncbi:MAG: DNA repair protein RecO (recombination protein O) [Parcubacteria group bacterium Gr01-1014_17]|nr:MAG: DNA repair protein RecO (recombination protein O) [Parcubacteria group bacterium Gr01-1014_17]